MRKLITLFALLLAFCLPLAAQTTVTSTTLAAAISTSSVTTMRVTSATGFVADTTFALIEKEVVAVTAVSGTTITITRGMNGTTAFPHNSGATVRVGPTSAFVSWVQDPAGRCTSTQYAYLPLINVRTGSLLNCSSSRWNPIANVSGFYTTMDSQPVTINSRDYNQASGSSIGFQVKPAQASVNADMIMGGEISPRINSAVAGKGIIGLHVDTWLRGTTGNLSGDVRTLNIEAYTDDAGARTISGNVSLIRLRTAFSATTITGKFVPFRVEKPETQTNSKTFDALFELTGSIPLVWNDNPGTEPSTADGYIKVLVDGNARYIQLFSSAPTD